MTADARELSARSGEPLLLVKFARGSYVWTYTNAAQDVVFELETYASAAISTSEPSVTNEAPQLNITLSLPASLPVLGNWYPNPTSEPVSVIVRTLHVGETDALVNFMGRAGVPTITGETADIQCEPSYQGARKPGLHTAWQKGCPYAVFSVGRYGCNAPEAAFTVDAVLSADISSLQVTSPTFAGKPDGWFAGGWLEWDIVPGLSERRSIKSHVGNTITLQWGSPLLINGLAVRAKPGCNGLLTTCRDKFNNLPNFGGDPFCPDRTPYDGNPVFTP